MDEDNKEGFAEIIADTLVTKNKEIDALRKKLQDIKELLSRGYDGDLEGDNKLILMQDILDILKR